jgi:bifunctional DNA primase/polymerase-like protein
VNSPTLAFDANNIDSILAAMQQPEPVPETVPEPEPRKRQPSPFELRAMPMIERGIPVIPLTPRTKIAFQTNWTALATTDPGKVAEIGREFPDANAACVAQAMPGGKWFFEVDNPDILGMIEKTAKIPETFTVSSSPGKAHFYFNQTDASIAMGNQGGKDKDGKESWSARVNNKYVVAAGSIHPTTGKAYTVQVDAPVVPAPLWLVEWVKDNAFDSAKNTDKARVNASFDGPPIPRGSHDNELFRIACMLRNAGMDYEQILDNLIPICEKRCSDHGNDYVDMCEKKAKQACTYPVGQASPRVVFGGGAGQSANQGASADTTAAGVEIPVIAQVPYPKFPSWVMKGTSVYDGFIEPICAVNTRFPEFMFMPAITLMLNYLALKVTIKSKPKLIPSIWMVAVGKKGRVIKSSCVNDTIEYLNSVGIIGQGNGARNAEGKSLIWTAGSTEGLGMEMTRTNCKNAVLFYDELGVMTSKVKIEASSMAKHLMTMYESGQFSNTIKARKENFDFPPGSYCASIIACNAEKTFLSNMGPILKAGEGMDERWFYLYQPDPKTWPVNKDYVFVNTVVGAQETKRRIDKALKQGVFEIDDFWGVLDEMAAVNNRMGVRVAKLALYFAVDLGKTEIDHECLERASAVAQYDLAVKHYLQVPEGATMEGQLQSEIINFLVRNAGRVTHRELNRRMHPERYGTSLWNKVYQGLLQGRWTMEQGTGKPNDPKSLVLMRVPEDDD